MVIQVCFRKVRDMKKNVMKTVIAVMMAGMMMSGCGNSAKEEAVQETVEETVEKPEEVSSQVASADEMTTKIDVVEEGMVPIPGSSIKDGIYDVKVDSSSSMFKIYSSELQVQDGRMNAVLKFEGSSYLKVFMGTGEEAVEASEEEYIPAVDVEEGFYTFNIPVEALDQGIECTAFSRAKEKWYDRTLVFRADSLPLEAFSEEMIQTVESLALEDGTYTMEVTLGGGSGKARIESPTRISIKEGKAYAVITWGSPNYDYMKVNGEKYLQTNTEGNSTFEIPVSAFDWKLQVIADTIAMSEPHEIEYTLCFDSSTLSKVE